MRCLAKEEISHFSSILKELSQDQRLKIICMLHHVKELCVCEIYEKLAIKQNLASHHLWVLKKLDFVETRREGNKIYYKLNYKVFSAFQEKIGILFNV